ncbi:MAG: hypothetical protein AAB490_00390 [Patescibacteria group bacterium]
MDIFKNNERMIAAFGICLILLVGVILLERSENKQTDTAAPFSDAILSQPISNGEDEASLSGTQTNPARGSRSASGEFTTTAFGANDDPRQVDTYQIATDNFRQQRLQFNNCTVNAPLRGVTFTGGSEILLEGVSNDPQIISLGESRVTLNGHDIVLVRLPQVEEPTKYSIGCEVNGKPAYNITSITVYP